MFYNMQEDLQVSNQKSIFFVIIVAAVAFFFVSNAGAGVMEDDGDIMESMEANVYSDRNKEITLKSGYFYQKASLTGEQDISEQGFTMSAGMTRSFFKVDVFGVMVNSRVRVEPEIMVGVTSSRDNSLSHLFVPAIVEASWLMPAAPVEVSVGAGTGLLIYDLGDQIDNKKFLPVIGTLSFDYIKSPKVKMGVEGRFHYVLNNPDGPIDSLWGASGTARVSFLF